MIILLSHHDEWDQYSSSKASTLTHRGLTASFVQVLGAVVSMLSWTSLKPSAAWLETWSQAKGPYHVVTRLRWFHLVASRCLILSPYLQSTHIDVFKHIQCWVGGVWGYVFSHGWFQKLPSQISKWITAPCEAVNLASEDVSVLLVTPCGNIDTGTNVGYYQLLRRNWFTCLARAWGMWALLENNKHHLAGR